MKDLDKRRKHKKKIVGQMIFLYCKKNHTQKGIKKNLRLKDKNANCNNVLCFECTLLQNYVNERIDRCPYMKTKSFCSQCPTPCYSKERRAEIKKIMRFSGPRMIFYHPLLTISHAYHTLIGK